MRIRESWNPETVDLYNSLVRQRLKEQNCAGCGASLEPAAQLWADDGTTLEEYALVDRSDVAVLAATEHLSVRCLRCGVVGDVGRASVHAPPAVEQTAPEAPWEQAAVGLYQSLIQARLADQRCSGCGQPLAAGSIVAVWGGTALDDFGLSDSSAAEALAATQAILLKCEGCGVEAKLQGAVDS